MKIEVIIKNGKIILDGYEAEGEICAKELNKIISLINEKIKVVRERDETKPEYYNVVDTTMLKESE